ncbi:MAG: hypothetical protein P1V20_29300 [Verrucomicrobiales bacterium]|nr:hypothetical protein [Verrucomicrobiales bacterium]
MMSSCKKLLPDTSSIRVTVSVKYLRKYGGSKNTDASNIERGIQSLNFHPSSAVVDFSNWKLSSRKFSSGAETGPLEKSLEFFCIKMKHVRLRCTDELFIHSKNLLLIMKNSSLAARVKAVRRKLYLTMPLQVRVERVRREISFREKESAAGR